MAAYYDAGVDSICTRMLSRIVQVNHWTSPFCYATEKCG